MKRLLFGVGNRLSRDDGVGPVVAEQMGGTGGWHAVDCGTSLENASGIAIRIRPDLLVVVDAARMGLSPGAVRRLPIESTDRMLASTHALPLSFVLDRLSEAVGETVLIGVQPGDLSFGEGLSPAVTEAVDHLLPILSDGLIDRIPTWNRESTG